MSTRRQFGSVRRLPSGRWQVRYRGPNGDAHTETFAIGSNGALARRNTCRRSLAGRPRVR